MLKKVKSIHQTFVVAAFLGHLFASESAAQFVLTGTSYTQDFANLGTSGLPSGWTTRLSATSSSAGASESFTNTAVSWGTTTGNFRNVAAATSLTSGASVDTQAASTNRALGIRQTGAFGDPGASFQFNFDSTGYTITGLSVDLMMLSVQGYSTTWNLQWSSDSGSTWTSLGPWTDSGTFGTTHLAVGGPTVVGMSDLSSVLFRTVALSAATGSGSRDTIAIDNFQLTYAAIPEPATYAAILGLISLGVVVWRRRRSSV